jgi:hypothetical protein
VKEARREDSPTLDEVKEKAREAFGHTAHVAVCSYGNHFDAQVSVVGGSDLMVCSPSREGALLLLYWALKGVLVAQGLGGKNV